MVLLYEGWEVRLLAASVLSAMCLRLSACFLDFDAVLPLLGSSAVVFHPAPYHLFQYICLTSSCLRPLLMRVGIWQSNQALKVTLVASWNAVGPLAHMQPLLQTLLCLCMSMQCAVLLTDDRIYSSWLGKCRKPD